MYNGGSSCLWEIIMKLTIAFDFDLTFVDSLGPWIGWVNNSGATPPILWSDIQDKGDLVPFFESRGVSMAWEYWLMADLYDNMKPMENAVEVLRVLKERGHTIICVSKCTPEHLESKKRMLDKYVPFIDGFVDTGDKQFVDFDVIIDDSDEMVLKIAEHGKKVIQPYTPPSKTVEHENVFSDAEVPYRKFWINTSEVVDLIEKWAAK